MSKKPTITIPIETKTFSFELKHVDEEQGIVEGYLSTFGNVDSGKDRVIRGAFKKTLMDAKSRMEHKSIQCLYPVLWMHFPDQPLGKCLDAYEDEQGLYVKFWLDITTNDKGFPNNPQATMVFSGYKNGYVNQQSMGYKALQKEYDNEGVRNLKECQLFELSCITSGFAMNDLADATSVKKNGTPMPDKTPQRKDFNDRYRQEQIRDWKSTDFNNLIIALQAAIMDIFAVGDSPQLDILSTILNGADDGGDAGNTTGFIDALTDYVQRGIDLDVANYLDDNPYFGSVSSYGYMSRNDKLEGKIGAVVSQSNAERIKAHIDNLMQVKDMVGTVAEDMQRYITGNEPFDPSNGDANVTRPNAGTELDNPKSSVRPLPVAPHVQPLVASTDSFEHLVQEFLAQEKKQSSVASRDNL